MPTTILICPGIHDRSFTDRFLETFTQLSIPVHDLLVLPTEQYPPFSAVHILQFLEGKITLSNRLILMGFSGGVVGAIGTAWGWQLKGGKVAALFALDGWGVPLGGDFPIHRISHDEFTHWSSGLLGRGRESFYADPPVEHLELWRSLYSITGWQVQSSNNNQVSRRQISLIKFLEDLLTQYIFKSALPAW